MKKSIWIAAAVFLVGALAGCTFGGDEENGGSKVENRFVGKTIVHEDTKHRDYDDGSWYTRYRRETITFAKNTATAYSEYRYTSSVSSKDVV